MQARSLEGSEGHEGYGGAIYNQGGTVRFYDTAEFSQNGAKVTAKAHTPHTHTLTHVGIFTHAGSKPCVDISIKLNRPSTH